MREALDLSFDRLLMMMIQLWCNAPMLLPAGDLATGRQHSVRLLWTSGQPVAYVQEYFITVYTALVQCTDVAASR